MNRFVLPLTPDLARAGRALAQVSVEEVAQASGLEAERVRRFERRGTPLGSAANDQLRAALEVYGVVFFGEDVDGGDGVRRKHSSLKTRQLKRWEDEGGPAFEDDI